MRSDLLASFGGEVSIAKFLGEPSEEHAQRFWTGLVSRELHDLPPSVRETMVVHPNSPALRLAEEVTVRFGLGEITISIDGNDTCEAALRPGVSAVIIASLGWSRWGERWSEQLRRFTPKRGPIVDMQDGTALPWIAQRPDEPGPWTAARTELDAAVIADAESLGTPRLREVYEELNRD
ncbi:MAG: hypothetical protein IJO71_05040 [Microbacterium sp.]|jgi:hypothetical protein|uniref:hypothetical protein n=1 Tax=Microbacterium sp. TaxID=51671 RepID=UPI0025FF8545|nr:hypothetical protein [Microbacterium sp.]MBQ9916553.1 hypothetical protein [Microbacterium sp.]